MDAAAATSLLSFAEEVRPRLRASDDASAQEDVEGQYAELLRAMDWFVGENRPDEAFRIASVLVPFWVATKRIDDGDRWFLAVTAAKGQHERAATLAGIAEKLLHRAGGEWPPDERAQFAGTLATLAGAPATAGVEERRAKGRAMPLDEAVAYAAGPGA